LERSKGGGRGPVISQLKKGYRFPLVGHGRKPFKFRWKDAPARWLSKEGTRRKRGLPRRKPLPDAGLPGGGKSLQCLVRGSLLIHKEVVLRPVNHKGPLLLMGRGLVSSGKRRGEIVEKKFFQTSRKAADSPRPSPQKDPFLFMVEEYSVMENPAEERIFASRP